jgi:hypothetical protein
MTILRIAPCPPYSLYSHDLALSGFWLFGHHKNPHQGKQFKSANELLSGVRKIEDAIGVGILEAGFREGINRLNRYIAANEQYVE